MRQENPPTRHLLPGTVILFLLALAGIWTAGRLSPAYTLDLGPQEWGRIQYANDWEQHGGATYRWTQGLTRFRLPVLGTPRRLVLRLDGSRPPGIAQAQVSLRLDGRALATFQPPAGPHLYHLTYEGSSPWAWETVVEIQSEPFQTQEDPRELGVIVDRLHFSAPLSTPAPSWTLVILWTLLGSLTLAAGYALGWPAYGAEVLAVLTVVAMSALLAWNRPAALAWAGLLLAVALVATAVALIFRRRRPDEQGAAWASPDGRPGVFALLCLALALGAAALPLLARWVSPERGWALHMLIPFYAPTGPILRRLLPWFPLTVVALAGLPPVNQELRLLVDWLWHAGSRLTSRVKPAGRWLLLGLLFVPLAYALRARILWGDGPSLISRIAAGYIFSEPEMLPFFLHGTLYRWTSACWGWSVPAVYTATSLVMGALYVALAAALSDVLGRDRFERTFVFGLLATLATIQFGFGYLENYAFISVALLALFWQMARCVQGGGSPAVVMGLWVLAGACHLQAVTLGPAVLYTVIRACWKAPIAARWRRVGGTVAGTVIPAAVLLGLFLAGGYDLGHLLQGNWTRGNNPYMFVPLRSADTYTLFSWEHLANVINEHLLVAPIVLPVLVLVVLRYGRWVPWREPLVLVLLLSAAGLLLFASTLYPDLSASMDWDLFAPSALPYTLLAGLLFTRAVPEGRGKRYTGTVLLVSAAVHTGMWVLVNAMVV